MKRHNTVAIIIALTMSTTPAFAIEIGPGHPDPDNQARAAALQKLEILSKPDTRAFLLEDTSVLKRASLSDPFIQFWTDESFVRYESASAGESMMRYVTRYCLSFPVVLDNQVLGTIDVIREQDHYRVVSTHVGDEQFRQVAMLRSKLDLRESDRLSIFTAVGIGNYAVIENGSEFLKMRPLDLQVPNPTAKTVSQSFLPEDNFASNMKDAIRESKKRAGESNKIILRPVDD